MDEPSEPGFKPPYLSFQTFWGFLEELATKHLPPQIDRSMLDKKSGTDQMNLLAAFKSFGLVDDAHAVQAELEHLVGEAEPDRKKRLASLLRRHYPRQFEVSDQNGTEKQLLESFEQAFGVTGDTRRKASTFFLHAARFAGMTLSPHFPATRGGSGRTATTKVKRTVAPKRRPGAPTTPAPATAEGAGDTYTVTLNSGGAVSVVVDVNLFSLSTDDRTFIIELVDKLKGYSSAGALQEDDA